MTLNQKLYQIASRYKIYQCDKCAQALTKWLKRNGKKYGVKQAKRIRISTGCTDIYDIKSHILYGDQLISETGFHLAIEVDGIVYDNLNPNGVSKTEWSSKFERIIDNSMFNRVVFGRYDTFIVTETNILI